MKRPTNRIAIIGAGVSGLTAGRLLLNTHSVTLFESMDAPGGLIRCREVNGNLFHTCGGHVFNTKIEKVRSWFESQFDVHNEFHHIDRNAVIAFNEARVPYPIENHLYYLPQDMQASILRELLRLDKALQPTNFEEFLLNHFGKTLYERYFKPYNEKIWHADLSSIALDWLEGKLPSPTTEEILLNNINHSLEKSFVHASFWYPKRGGSQFLANRLADGLDIRYNTPIQQLNRTDQGKWNINGECFDSVFFCGNIKDLPALLPHDLLTDNEREAISALAYHGTTTVLCEIEKNPFTWIYLPQPEYSCHRIICTGNLSPTNNATGRMTATVEFTDAIAQEAILENLSKAPFSLSYIAHVYHEYTYPIQTKDTRALVAHLKDKLRSQGIYLSGRFANWEYYNMDVAMNAAMKECEIFETTEA